MTSAGCFGFLATQRFSGFFDLFCGDLFLGDVGPVWGSRSGCVWDTVGFSILELDAGSFARDLFSSFSESSFPEVGVRFFDSGSSFFVFFFWGDLPFFLSPILLDGERGEQITYLERDLGLLKP